LAYQVGPHETILMVFARLLPIPLLFSAHVYCGHGRRSQLLLSFCLTQRPTACSMTDYVNNCVSSLRYCLDCSLSASHSHRVDARYFRWCSLLAGTASRKQKLIIIFAGSEKAVGSLTRAYLSGKAYIFGKSKPCSTALFVAYSLISDDIEHKVCCGR